MGIKQKGGLTELRSRMHEVKLRVDKAIFMRLSYIGEELVNYARSIPADIGYTDQTGNLRSSTGYIIALDGSVKTAMFKPVKGGNVNAGRDHALSVLAEYSRGWVLIIAAGMNYALAVESRGRDVLTGTEILANRKVPVEINKLKESINRMKI